MIDSNFHLMIYNEYSMLIDYDFLVLPVAGTPNSMVQLDNQHNLEAIISKCVVVNISHFLHLYMFLTNCIVQRQNVHLLRRNSFLQMLYQSHSTYILIKKLKMSNSSTSSYRNGKRL